MTGEELKKIRKELHLTQEQLGKELGVAMRTIQSWEYGKRPVPLPMQSLIKNLYKKYKVVNATDGNESLLDAIGAEQILMYILKNIDKFKNLSILKAVIEVFSTAAQNEALEKIYKELKEIKDLKESIINNSEK